MSDREVNNSIFEYSPYNSILLQFLTCVSSCSVLNKSPAHLIHEVLLYDDDSDLDELQEGSWFAEHIKSLPKARLERSKHGRGGLIRVSSLIFYKLKYVKTLFVSA